LQAAAAFAQDFGEFDRASTYREGARHMQAAMRKHLWNPEQQRFARNALPAPHNGDYKLDMTSDSANFAIFAFAGLPIDDPQVESEMREMQKRLSVKTGVGGYARYEHDYYHQVEREKIEQVPGNPWVICTLWRAQYVIARAKSFEDLKEAEGLLEWCVSRAEASGVLAEQHHPYTGEPISVSPLTWSHATYIMVVMEYARKVEELRRKA
jgi:GH15 family glucan-1,4-alpha-glucosidase